MTYKQSHKVENIRQDADTGKNKDDSEVGANIHKEAGAVPCEKCKKSRKSKQSYIAVIIVLAGIAGGSFFIDIVQLFVQKGFSARAVHESQVIEFNGDTWVRYDDPKVQVEVFDADDCAECMTDEVLAHLRAVMPTIEARRIDMNTEEGKQYAQAHNISYIPSFLFSHEVLSTDFYQQGALLFSDNENQKYMFDIARAGVNVGRYLTVPQVNRGFVFGNQEAKNSIVIFNPISSDYKNMNTIADKIISDFENDVVVSIYVMPQDDQPRTTILTRAINCAHAQNMYFEFSEEYAKNSKSYTENTNYIEEIKKYAKNIKMDEAQLDVCLVDKNTQKNIDQMRRESVRFGVSTSSPTVFINGQIEKEKISYELLQDRIKASRE